MLPNTNHITDPAERAAAGWLATIGAAFRAGRATQKEFFAAICHRETFIEKRELARTKTLK